MYASIQLFACATWLSTALALDFYAVPSSIVKRDSITTPSVNQPVNNTLGQVQEAVQRAIANGMTEDLVVNLADGLYMLDAPLNFTSADSGTNGHSVVWKAAGEANVTVSGGMQITGWTENSTSGIYHASVPKGTQSRNLYVNGWAANYARTQLNRTYFTPTNTTYNWNISEYDWLMTTPGIANAELRSIQSFTDRYAPISAVGHRELIMVQDCWKDQVIGYDDYVTPYADFGLFVQNALALLDEGGEFFLDSEQGTVYYMPLEGEDMSTAETYLGIQEALFVIGGTYDDPAHDIMFENINFAHTTWLKPGQGFGYVDQQTGGYLGQNVTYPDFEAARSHWDQMPSAIQISAAQNIHFSGGTYTELGAGGFGIGNDPNAHLTGIGLGAKNVSVTNGYFTQVMGNSVTAGGIQIPAHHPNDTRMINSEIHVDGNIFFNVSSLFSSTVPILYTYVQYSTITNNDVFHVPYSGICVGYGWGMNDAGGSSTYVMRGTYQYQPIFQTPTTAQNNVIQGNLVHDYGWSHTDLGAIYTLSKSPSTYIMHNYVLNSSWYGVYTDEGTNSYIILENDFLSTGELGSGFGWYNPNQGEPPNPGMHTANQTLIDNFGLYPPNRDFTDAPDGTGILGNTFDRNFIVFGLKDTTALGHRVAYRAGIPLSERGSRPASNPSVPSAYISVDFQNGQVVATVYNFEDSDVQVTFKIYSSHDVSIQKVSLPTTIEADSLATAVWDVTAQGCVEPPAVMVQAVCTDSQTGRVQYLSINGTMPGTMPLNQTWSTSATWPAHIGQACGGKVAISTGGRDVNGSFDDWAVAYHASAISAAGNVTAQVLSLDAAAPESKAGVVIRDSFQTTSPANDARHVNATGYAAVLVTSATGVIFAWDVEGNGYLNHSTTASNVRAPVWVRLAVTGSTEFAGYYSVDGSSWTQIGASIKLPRNASQSDAGVLVNSHAGFNNATAVFGDFEAM